MTRKLQAFTLIELMVVVAIIAILATLSVSNFSTAIRRTRNTNRVSDIQAVAKAMETCYDPMTGQYNLQNITAAEIQEVGLTSPKYTIASSDTAASGIFKKANLKCLNEDIIPTVASFDYSGGVVKSGGVQSFYACAKLEQVDGWENVGNNSKNYVEASSDGGQITWKLDKCGGAGSVTADNCYFCAVGSQ